MKHTDVKQMSKRNLLLVGLRYKDVLKQCQTMMKSDACTADHLLNLARQPKYRDTIALRLTKTVTTNAHAHTLQDTFFTTSFGPPTFSSIVTPDLDPSHYQK